MNKVPRPIMGGGGGLKKRNHREGGQAPLQGPKKAGGLLAKAGKGGHTVRWWNNFEFAAVLRGKKKNGK